MLGRISESLLCIGDDVDLVVYVYEADTDVGRMIAQYSAGIIGNICPTDWSRESSPLNDNCAAKNARQDPEGSDWGDDSSTSSMESSTEDQMGATYCSAAFTCGFNFRCLPLRVGLAGILFGFLLPTVSSCMPQ